MSETPIPPILRDPSGELQLRRADKSDSAYAYETKKVAFREYVEACEGWNEVEQRRRHHILFTRNDYRIVCLSGTPCGILSIRLTDNSLKLNQLFLRPAHQGNGIGRRCMDILTEVAGERRLPIYLNVMKVNPRAKSFYERLEFRVTDTSATHFEMAWQP